MTDPKRLWVVNASPIISLANIGYANILIESCNHLVIPQALETEILAGPNDDPAKQWIMATGKEYVLDIGMDFRIDQNLYHTALQMVGEKP